MTTTTETTTTPARTPDLFDEIIADWKERQVVTTLTREERDQEYLIALDKLQDYIKKEIELAERMEGCPELREVRIQMSLRSYILTEEEEKEEINKGAKEFKEKWGPMLGINIINT